MAEHPDAAVVRRACTAFQQGDLDTLSTLVTADLVQHVPGDNMLSGHHKGRDACMQLWRTEYEETGGTLRVDIESVMPDGRGHVISGHRCRAERGNRTMDMKTGLFFTIVGGKITDIDECVEDIDAADAFWGK
ncbi:nuclear transport factor 2 family protein [Streptomyces botrytidirepellens]|uniref:Nuclear transport factor 2 family protein n=1 Tax=Streptomyces botrytidirepellens TaxID=2486417 RepID=A0A3M8WBG0_9ACTN|nr:nuclear transport factor 2 family protein [Streptomyces botrytidirepellens]RNG27406.1 nuclear transport factor 2 family protein [Streptomyces botrytidirepellens]